MPEDLTTSYVQCLIHSKHIVLFSSYAVLRVQTFNHTGGYYREATPVPIPNTEVKLACADNTWLATAREDRLLPVFYSSIAQSVERSAVNRNVTGSSPV